MPKLCIVLSIIVSLTLSACATTYNPATGQEELIFISTPTEVSIGNMLAAKIAKQFKITDDKQRINRVTKIGKDIVGVSDRKDLKYRFYVIEDESLNAFTTPGGYVYVNSGVIDKASDDEIACVIGHEVGHIAARHIAKKMQAQIGYDILVNIATRGKSSLRDLERVASVGYDLIMLGYSREDELLADKLGVKYAYKAGYDPYAMITFLKRLKETEKEEIGFSFLRSHPYVSQRIELLEKEMQEDLNPAPMTMAQDKTRPLKVMCPVCKRIFEGTTNYCPYDGTKLE